MKFIIDLDSWKSRINRMTAILNCINV